MLHYPIDFGFFKPASSEVIAALSSHTIAILVPQSTYQILCLALFSIYSLAASFLFAGWNYWLSIADLLCPKNSFCSFSLFDLQGVFCHILGSKSLFERLVGFGSDRFLLVHRQGPPNQPIWDAF